MPMHCDWRQNQLTITLAGDVDWEEGRQIPEQISRDRRLDSLRFIVVDLFHVEESTLSARHLRTLAHQLRALSLSNPRITLAMVLPFEGASKLEKYLLQTMQHSPWRIRTFLTRKQADVWVSDVVVEQLARETNQLLSTMF